MLPGPLFFELHAFYDYGGVAGSDVVVEHFFNDKRA
jgi:hypothetical protein